MGESKASNQNCRIKTVEFKIVKSSNIWIRHFNILQNEKLQWLTSHWNGSFSIHYSAPYWLNWIHFDLDCFIRIPYASAQQFVIWSISWCKTLTRPEKEGGREKSIKYSLITVVRKKGSKSLFKISAIKESEKPSAEKKLCLTRTK